MTMLRRKMLDRLKHLPRRTQRREAKVRLLLTKRADMVKDMGKHGYAERVVVPLIIVQVVCALLYVIPQTAVLGAVLITGWLGGAVATHVIAGERWFFPVIFGIVVWLGLFLRDRRVRALLPLRT